MKPKALASLRRSAALVGLVPGPGEPADFLAARVARVLREDLRSPTLEDLEARARAVPGVYRVTGAVRGGGTIAVLVEAASPSDELRVAVEETVRRSLGGLLSVGIALEVLVRPPGPEGDALEAAWRLGGGR